MPASEGCSYSSWPRRVPPCFNGKGEDETEQADKPFCDHFKYPVSSSCKHFSGLVLMHLDNHRDGLQSTWTNSLPCQLRL
ncbi:hypothetical protein Y1Q_0022100 [Alligator mississippiensis]|uniref:Uncharacterized protein n=1 Tax=Alligator mississippiensis TaxID=8496 RepID=A0A151M4P5_ALLMI|nr:hypothetical protein Y1Q_0022100 [Alligator mississippiensis]